MKFPYLNLKFFRVELQKFPSPLRTLERLYGEEDYFCFYESLNAEGKEGRYSIIAAKPLILFEAKKGKVKVTSREEKLIFRCSPMEILREIFKRWKKFPPVNPFPGGALGFVSYDAIRYFEKIPDLNPEIYPVPDMLFLFPSEIIIFDREKEAVDLIVYYLDSVPQQRIELLIKTIEEEKEVLLQDFFATGHIVANLEKSSFSKMVRKAKEYIKQGDIFQVVLSRVLSCPCEGNPIALYRKLRRINPAPFMYLMRFKELFLLCSSPEILVELKGKDAISRPLAGTRKRGSSRKEDVLLEEELLADEKERAEHIMLVDLARNDLGRVCEPGSVQVPELLKVERFAKVMHIVSTVKGRLREDKDCFDLFQATFPAGTVSGAPKVRAMEIIEELEPSKRGIYAGTIGFFSCDGNMSMSIAIRTIVVQRKQLYLQTGAGIVADSIPEKEFKETNQKALALLSAINSFEEGHT